MILKKILFVACFFCSISLMTQEQLIAIWGTKNGLPSNQITAIEQDKIGYLWIGTDQGLVKFDGEKFTRITTKKVTAIFSQNHKIFVGQENGLLLIDKNKEFFFESKKVLQILSVQDTVFTATTQGISVVKENILQPISINSEIDFGNINALHFFKNSWYIASNSGLWIVNSLINPTKIERLFVESIVSLTSFHNNLVAATEKNTLIIFDKDQLVKTIESMPNLAAIKILKNELWIASTTNGIEVLTLPSYSFKQKINKYNTLNTNRIQSVFLDKQNLIWLATNAGLFRMDTFNESLKTKFKPQVFIENIQINYQNMDANINNNERLQLESSENNISISFKTVDLKNPSTIKYRYKLSKQFSPWSTENTVQFANLSSGNYEFEVQSKNTDFTSNSKKISFAIKPPFYQTTSFILLFFIGLFSVGYFSLHFYLRQIHAKNTKKVNQLKLQNHLITLEQKALQLQMNPHFIFNVLNGIKALGNANKITALNHTISQFSVLLRGILNNSRQEKITLNEEITLLKNYIELEQRMSSKSFLYTINTQLNGIDADEILIPTMLIQPFVENCIQHAFVNRSQGKIEICFRVIHSYLQCTIEDNGIGIQQSKKQQKKHQYNSAAIDISKERIQNLSEKSSFSVVEIIEKNQINGTKVTFMIPLETDF